MPRLLQAVAKAIAPPNRLSPSAWAEKNFYLSPEASAEPGLINFDRAPYQRQMLDAVRETGIEDVVIMTSAQVGKSTCQLAVVGWLIDLHPGPIMWVAPTLEMAESTSKTRIAPMIRDSPVLTNKIKAPGTRSSGNTLREKAFPGGQLTLVGSNSPAGLASRPIRVIIGDEVDRYDESAGTEGDPVELVKKRTTTYWNRLHFWVSTPTIQDRSRIEKMWLVSDRRHFEMPCPHCGHRQDLKWDGVVYEKKGEINLSKQDVGEVFYRCENCGQDIPESAKAKMLAQGQWVKRGASAKIAGFHLNELYSPWKSWQDVARDYEAANGDPLRMQVFWNTSLGLPYEIDGKLKFAWENLEYRSERSEYSAGQIPEGVLLLTAGVDIQGDRLECSVFGWGVGEECWLIRHEVIYGDPLEDDCWNDLDLLLNHDYPHPLGGTIKVRKAAVDSGYHTQEVYRRGRNKAIWMLVKGVAGDRKLVSPATWQEINWMGKPIKRGVKLHTLGVDLLKQTILGRCKVAMPGPKHLNLPNNLPQKYCQELAGSEVMMKKKSGATWKYIWQPVPGVRNEPLDCAVYAYAAAIFLGLSRFTDRHWEKMRNLLAVDLGDSRPNDPEKSLPEPPPEKPTRKKRPPRRPFLKSYGGR